MQVRRIGDLCLHSDLRGSVSGFVYIGGSTRKQAAYGSLMQEVWLADEAQTAAHMFYAGRVEK
jgi:hypothetical protein